MSRLRYIIHLVAYGLRPILIVLEFATATASVPTSR